MGCGYYMFLKSPQWASPTSNDSIILSPGQSAKKWIHGATARLVIQSKHLQSAHQASRLALPLSRSPSGIAIRDHINSRRHGFRIGDALSVLRLPHKMDDYLRGESRQAMRTNIRRAINLGYKTSRVACDRFCSQAIRAEEYGQRFKWIDMLLAEKPTGDLEHWIATDKADRPAALARVQIDYNVAWLKYLVSTDLSRNSGLRYKLSSDIIEYLISQKIEYVIVGLVYELNTGLKYFQDRLGFETMSVFETDGD